MGQLSKLPNIGKCLEKQLNEVGIQTVEQLIKVGSKQAWLNIKAIDTSSWVNKLYALEGAVQGINRLNISEEIKSELKEFARNLN